MPIPLKNNVQFQDLKIYEKCYKSLQAYIYAVKLQKCKLNLKTLENIQSRFLEIKKKREKEETIWKTNNNFKTTEEFLAKIENFKKEQIEKGNVKKVKT